MAKKPSTRYGKSIVPIEVVAQRIYLIRGQKVMLSPDLAALYRVEPRALVQEVKRNSARFPADFMFQLSGDEYANLKSQIVISSWGGARRANPYAFTEHGVAMLSAVLKSDRAVQMSVRIIRAFVRLREIQSTNKDLAARLDKVERTQEQHASVITILAEEIDNLKLPPPEPPRRIGFVVDDEGEG